MFAQIIWRLVCCTKIEFNKVSTGIGYLWKLDFSVDCDLSEFVPWLNKEFPPEILLLFDFILNFNLIT
jgi:hypothetical protein